MTFMTTPIPAPKREPAPDRIILGLIRTFPCLTPRAQEWLDRTTQFDPDEFHALFARASSCELLGALFILNVWNRNHAEAKDWHFDFVAFIHCADLANYQALLNWMAKPYLL